MQKVVLLLQAGVMLSLSASPNVYFRVLRQAAKEWDKIDQRSLHEAIRKLYRSQLVDLKENENGTVSLFLSQSGKNKVLRYDLDKLKIPKPIQWDKCWRVIIFDIPERHKQGRNALADKLRQLGFFPMQKSVFVHPYPCWDEVNFVVELFELKPYVRTLLVKEIDIDLDLRRRFNLN